MKKGLDLNLPKGNLESKPRLENWGLTPFLRVIKVTGDGVPFV